MQVLVTHYCKRSYTYWYFLIFFSGIFLISCAANPVTGKREFSFLEEKEEVKIGADSFVPIQQAQGGPYVADPEIASYVSEIGHRLAKVSHRPNLPFEFVVLNRSEPNAWTLPGGKIAINRGLLLELNSEAELAAVLAHEIVHAAARHGAHIVERQLAFDLGLHGIDQAFDGVDHKNILVGAANVGALFINSKYGRSKEFEADKYGIIYMQKAGYDPNAAVELQKTFVRLANEKKDPNWLAGLFASHPPSQERVDENYKTLALLPKGGKIGQERYQQAISRLKDASEAYVLLESGYGELERGNSNHAIAAARKALRIEPREGLFYQLFGEAKMKQERYTDAIASFNEAIQRNPNLYNSFLLRGTAKKELGDFIGARKDIEQSLTLLPSAQGYYTLAEAERQSGLSEQALRNYATAASATNELGSSAKTWIATLDLSARPEKYIGVSSGTTEAGFLTVTLFNRSPIPIRDVVILIDRKGVDGIIQASHRLTFPIILQAGQSSHQVTEIGPFPSLDNLRDEVALEINQALPAH